MSSSFQVTAHARVMVKVCIIQLECHPAFRIGTASYSSEPFVDDDPRPCLQELWDHGFPVEELQSQCRSRYHIWHRARLNSIVTWLRRLPVDDFPDIIVFPEGAIPRQFLSCLHRKLDPAARKVGREYRIERTGPLIFAGTHAFEHSPEAWNDYEQLGVSRALLSKLGRLDLDTVSVMPVLFPTGKVELFPKLALSPFERTAIGRQTALDQRAGRSVSVELPRLAGESIKIQAFVCAEALQYTGSDDGTAPDLAVILSYDRKPTRFSPLVEHYAANQIPVVYVNDGAFGGSRIHSPPDFREENWPRLSQLPEGDGIAIVEVALRANAPTTGVNNPHGSHSLLKLSPVIPENATQSSWRVSAAVEEWKKNVKSQTDAGAPVDTPALMSSIAHLMEFESPTHIQRLQLERLLALSRDGAATPREWRVFADDCRIKQNYYKRSHSILTKFQQMSAGTADDARAKGQPFTPPSLRTLESDLATHCYNRISLLLDASESRDLSILLKARERLARKVGGRLRGSAPEAVSNLLHRINREAVRTARVRLTNLLGEIVERFHATSGMLFIVQPNHTDALPKLVAQILLNTPVREIERMAEPKGEGIVGRVAASQTPYLNNWVSSDERNQTAFLDPYYRETVRSTRAELAVPIFAPTTDGRTTELIGVLNLESRIAGTFSAIQIPQIEALAGRMAIDIRVMQAAVDSKRILVWHPEVHGWGTKRILDRLCYEIATSHSGNEHPPTVSATIWHTDRDKERFYVRGTSRYDFEYVCDAFLGFDSFLGHTLKTGQEGVPIRGAVEDLPHFRRRRKAERMELARVAATRFRAQRRGLGSQRSSEGVLALYSFRHEMGGNEADFDVAFTDTRIRNLANQIGAAVGDFLELRLQFALALLREKLCSSAVSGIDEFDQIKDVLSEILEAQAATCFINDRGKLRPASTTGLEVQGPRYKAGKKIAPQGDIVGMTEYLASIPGRVLRKFDIPDPTEPCLDLPTNATFRIKPRNLQRELGAATRDDHRRFLGASIGSDGEVSGVIRLVRSEGSKPFVESDEELLVAAIRVCESVFATAKLQHSANGRFGALTSDVNRLRALSKAGQSFHIPIERLFEQSARPTGSIRWLDAWLQDYRQVVGSLLPKTNAVLTHIRHAFQDDKLDWQLRVLAYHSAVSKYFYSDDEVFPHRKGNIGWKTIDRHRNGDWGPMVPTIVHFDAQASDLYDCGGIEHGLHVQSGICVPVTWIGDHRLISGVVSIDFDGPSRPSAADVRDIFLCSHSLSNLVSRLNPARIAPLAIETHEDWLRSAATALEACALVPVNRTSAKSVFLGSGMTSLKRQFSNSWISRKVRWDVRFRWLDDFVRLGAAVNGRTIRCPLRVGPFTAFELVGRLSDEAYGLIQQRADAEYGVWLGAEKARHSEAEINSMLESFAQSSGMQLKKMFVKRELSRFVFDLAAQWADWTSLAGRFWQSFDVAFQLATTRLPDENGLQLWDAHFTQCRRSTGRTRATIPRTNRSRARRKRSAARR